MRPRREGGQDGVPRAATQRGCREAAARPPPPPSPGWAVLVCPPVCCVCSSAGFGMSTCGRGLWRVSVVSFLLGPFPRCHEKGLIACLLGPCLPVSVSGRPASSAVRLAYVSFAGWRVTCGGGASPVSSAASGEATGGARATRPGSAAASWWAWSSTVAGSCRPAPPAGTSTCALGVGAGGRRLSALVWIPTHLCRAGQPPLSRSLSLSGQRTVGGWCPLVLWTVHGWRDVLAGRLPLMCLRWPVAWWAVRLAPRDCRTPPPPWLRLRRPPWSGPCRAPENSVGGVSVLPAVRASGLVSGLRGPSCAWPAVTVAACVPSVFVPPVGPVVAAWWRAPATVWASVGPCGCGTVGWGPWRGVPACASVFGVIAPGLGPR